MWQVFVFFVGIWGCFAVDAACAVEMIHQHPFFSGMYTHRRVKRVDYSHFILFVWRSQQNVFKAVTHAPPSIDLCLCWWVSKTVSFLKSTGFFSQMPNLFLSFGIPQTMIMTLAVTLYDLQPRCPCSRTQQLRADQGSEELNDNMHPQNKHAPIMTNSDCTTT